MGYHTPKAPLAQAIAAIVGTVPPFEMDGIWWFKDCPDLFAGELEDWCCYNISKTDNAFWATGSGVIEAAEHLLKTAIENANLCPSEPWKL